MNVSIDSQRFGGMGRLYGSRALERLARAHVAVVGVGGVGSWAVEALARSGVGRLTLIDMDDVCITNTNRQLPALEGEIGRPKVEVLAERVARIYPGCAVEPVSEFFLESTADRLLAPEQPYHWVVDAVDRAAIKTLLIVKARERGIEVLTVGGAGGRRDPTQVRCSDLGSTVGDVLLRQVRRELRRSHGWANGAGREYGVSAVYSAEPQMFPQGDGTVCATKSGGEGNLRMDCASGYGAACFVTGAFGFAAAGEVVRRIALA